MEERFELFGKHCIKDNSPDARRQLLDAYVACVILNDQDKKIKELEQENLSLQEQSIRDNQNWIEEVEQLKKSQKQLAIETLEKLKKVDFKKIIYLCSTPAAYIEGLIDNKLKSLKGGKDD